MPRYLSFHIFFLCYVLFCFVLTSPPLMLCVYLQTFEAALCLEEEVAALKTASHHKTAQVNDNRVVETIYERQVFYCIGEKIIHRKIIDIKKFSKKKYVTFYAF